ncbi:MAG TPA: hypothetical protein VHS31_02725 [Tepidisphaeraceae bacterium]|jgi:hypothetical protein|nr:hypothetical protein [Tepidisphaeraceae bacterium]
MRHFISLACLLVGLSILASRTSIVLAQDADAPTIAKDSIQVTAYTLNSYQKSFDTWSWVPQIQFRVNGPITSGSQLWTEWKLPTGPWVKFDCKTEEVKKGKWVKTESNGHDVPEDKGSTYTGPVDFTIHLRNELAGTDVVLFTGKMKVAKEHSNESAAKTAEHNVYYVDQDWNLPIGYVYLTRDSVSAMNLPTVNVAFWARGDATDFQPHLFYQGKEVGKITFENNEMGKASFKADTSIEPTHTVDDSLPQKAQWSRIVCTFPNVKAWDKTGQPAKALPGQKGTRHILKDNPGEYEVKVLWKGKLARSIKFTVGPDGKADDSITKTNKMGDDRAIVPVQIIGDQDGQWDKDAWKTDAFYGNPLTGFTAVP